MTGRSSRSGSTGAGGGEGDRDFCTSGSGVGDFGGGVGGT